MAKEKDNHATKNMALAQLQLSKNNTSNSLLLCFNGFLYLTSSTLVYLLSLFYSYSSFWQTPTSYHLHPSIISQEFPQISYTYNSTVCCYWIWFPQISWTKPSNTCTGNRCKIQKIHFIYYYLVTVFQLNPQSYANLWIIFFQESFVLPADFFSQLPSDLRLDVSSSWNLELLCKIIWKWFHYIYACWLVSSDPCGLVSFLFTCFWNWGCRCLIIVFLISQGLILCDFWILRMVH